jgi:hypothetical protein
MCVFRVETDGLIGTTRVEFVRDEPQSQSG